MLNKMNFNGNFFLLIAKISINIIGAITKFINFKYYYNFNSRPYKSNKQLENNLL
jgi:hypothetical protein